MAKMTVAGALKFMKKRGMLLVFPQENRKEPASLWYEFFPRTKMRWEWDESGDNRVGELWMLRERLSLSRKVVYSKWFKQRATLIAIDLFPALLKLANPAFPEVSGLSFAAREILDLLDEDSPLSTKQLKKMTGLQGRASESAYQRALKELWDRFLIVAYGEVDEGAFPSLAIGSTHVIFEDLWNEAVTMSADEAATIVETRLPDGTSFKKYWQTLLRRWSVAATMGFITCVCSLSWAASGDAELCAKWDLPTKVGELNTKIVGESSGIAISRVHDLIYHMNDSGTGPEFYTSKLDGSSLTSVHVEGYTPIDPEELSLGPCPLTPTHTCLVIFDIGDNLKRRKSISLFFVEEKNPFSKSVKPQFVARFKYPDGPHNAEAATVLENGDVIIVTKEATLLGVASPAVVFRAKRDDYLKANDPSKPAKLEKIGELDLPSINLQKGIGGVATGLASISSGERFTVLTYTGAIEFSLDLKGLLPLKIPVAKRKIVPLFQLPQQESVAYDKNERDLVYSTEVLESVFGIGTPAPIFKVRCTP